MDRRQFYFRQRVTEGELNTAFEKAELADRNMAADVGTYGILTGAVPVQHDPVANLTIDLSGPTTAYDLTGRRIRIGTGLTVNLAVDEDGISTSVPTVGQERWLAVFLHFKRLEDDARVDGNGDGVNFVQDESYEVVVRQGAAAGAGTAVRVPLDDEMILICDVKRTQAAATILNAAIDTTRRQAFVYTDASHIELAEAVWTLVSSGSVQAAIETLDAYLGAGGTLRNQADAAKGAALVGFAAAAAGSNSISAGTVRAAIIAVRDALNTHVADTSAAHEAASIGGLSVVTSPVTIEGSDLGAYLLALQTWVRDHCERLIGSTFVNLATGASATALNNLTEEPLSVRVRVAEVSGGVPSDTKIHNGQDPAGGGVELALIDVVVQKDGANYDVIVKNNTAFDVRVYVQAFRVG